MMTKIKSSNKAKFRYLLGAIMAIALLILFACDKKEGSAGEAEEIENGAQLKSAIGEQPLVIIDGELATMEVMQKLNPQAIHSVNVVKEVNEAYANKYGDLAKNGVVEITLKSSALDAEINPVEEVTVVGYGKDFLESQDEVFNIVDEMPEFPGGEQALKMFIAKSVTYPEYAKENSIQGKVYVTFVVENDGSVERIKIARGVDLSLDAEALKVVSKLPKWKPGKQDGEAVAVQYTVPINFVLQ